MVKHIVLYTLKEGVDKTEAVKLIASVLEPLVGKIPGLLHLEIRQAFNGMDYALYSEFGVLIEYGLVDDVDAAIAEYIQMQKDAGLDKIIQEVQAQVDAYMASRQ